MMVKVVRYLPKPESAFHRCLQPIKEKRSFMGIFLTKVSDLQPKKWLHQKLFPVSLPNISELFFAKHVWVVTAFATYHSFSLVRQPH